MEVVDKDPYDGRGNDHTHHIARTLWTGLPRHTLQIAKQELTMADIAAKPGAATDTRAVPAAKNLGLIAVAALVIGNLIRLRLAV